MMTHKDGIDSQALSGGNVPAAADCPKRRRSRACSGPWLAVAAPIAAIVLSACSQPPPKQSPMPKVPVTAKQQRINELMYRLYNYTHSDSSRFNEPWKGAIIELAQIGKPAVPTLTAVLDRTDHDVMMQSIAFTLRGIGDPAAVPSLIRALPRTARIETRRGGSDADRPMEFREEASSDGQYPLFLHGRAAQEIAAALEALTGHTEGRQYVAGGTTNNPETMAKVARLRSDAARRWRQWWSANEQRSMHRTAVAKAEPPPPPAKPVSPPTERTPTMAVSEPDYVEPPPPQIIVAGNGSGEEVQRDASNVVASAMSNETSTNVPVSPTNPADESMATSIVMEAPALPDQAEADPVAAAEPADESAATEAMASQAVEPKVAAAPPAKPDQAEADPVAAAEPADESAATEAMASQAVGPKVAADPPVPAAVAAESNDSGWGAAVDGLRCRWKLPTGGDGGPLVIAMELQNVSDTTVYWECRKGVTWRIRQPGVRSGYATPTFAVAFEVGSRPATVREVRTHLNVRSAGAAEDAAARGFYALAPGTGMTLSATYPWKMANSGTVGLDGHFSRYYQLGWNLDLRQVTVTCPMLKISVRGGP